MLKQPCSLWPLCFRAPCCEYHHRPSSLRSVHKDGENKGRSFYCCSLPRPAQCSFFQVSTTRHPVPPTTPNTTQSHLVHPNTNTTQYLPTPTPPSTSQQHPVPPSTTLTGSMCNDGRWSRRLIGPSPQWADLGFPECNHGRRSVRRAVLKLGANNGRSFYCCGAKQGKQCEFFQWVESGC